MEVSSLPLPTTRALLTRLRHSPLRPGRAPPGGSHTCCVRFRTPAGEGRSAHRSGLTLNTAPTSALTVAGPGRDTPAGAERGGGGDDDVVDCAGQGARRSGRVGLGGD